MLSINLGLYHLSSNESDDDQRMVALLALRNKLGQNVLLLPSFERPIKKHTLPVFFPTLTCAASAARRQITEITAVAARLFV